MAAAIDSNLTERFSGQRFTWYEVGGAAGACGQYHSDSEFVVALNAAQFGSGYPGPHCFHRITISYGGKTTTAEIVDECPGCPYGALDLSPSLFSFFAPKSVGVISGSWSFS
ncbi:uncharacterized protein STEHIDRAFT_52829 [Stereum hirsutum FP-91666 SS1]|uniref:uncharacterized protein n=1 Tax=Stereum hirsutum (strain FP-91666) TaxID=721885 RepID=UPI0004409D2F|nr:uncharacterized protein STEHIDRAFT_52829 [Stereum hirsutum FP-91666 SS1]EIM89298.1 hypothetical protein STEHIDRAFT_52829 [Stereum hirsutum FP-91666 SS1]